ncbi:AraC family transcriptional regulator [Fulvivirga sp. 29W222]|uniref:AraC family transcriptional regulator n=1 Tax=Fulvivirga marina TaxID=2494733 RepID=A0A937FVL5_9BACT|nr:helix-turn-helix domain-containing protein [Fulvivirga marina]MBL6445086.1 AraC family transcriptional regulator [Fulvivirga marina]
MIERDTFVSDILDLLYAFHTEQRRVDFYAEKMNLSVKTLSRKVKDKLQVSIGQLIRQEIIKTSKKYLKIGMSVNEIARTLNFEEPNHFTAFFKQYVGVPPSDYPNPKVQ